MLNYRLFKDNGLIIKSISKINSSYLISDSSNRYIVKKHEKDLNDMFNYLSSRSFNNYPKYKQIDDYDIYEFIEDFSLSKEERLYEMINLLILLHSKTTKFKNIDIDDYKIIYENLNKEIEYLYNYYQSLNDYIDSEIYMSPSHYLLVLNISKIYNALSFCKNELENWYELIKNSTRQRVVLIHNNLDLEHVLFNRVPYFISWNKSKTDLPIYDLIAIYNKYNSIVDFDILLNHYQKKYPLTKEELKLLFIMISIPFKIDLSNDEFSNIREIKKLITNIGKGDKLIKKYYINEKQKVENK